MTVSVLADHDVRDQFSAYVDPRFKEQKDYEEFGADFDAWLATVKANARAEGYVAGRIDGINDASAAIISELNEKVANSIVTGSEARAFKSGLTIAKSIVERVANRLALSAKNKR